MYQDDYYEEYAPPEESVYKLIPPTVHQPVKPPMYRSKYDGRVPVQKKGGSTFGPPPSQASNPTQYLRSHEKDIMRDRSHKTSMGPSSEDGITGQSYGVSKFQYPDSMRKQALPTSEDVPVMGLRSNKNYVHSNAVDNILSGFDQISR
jgi:hypothetical protein